MAINTDAERAEFEAWLGVKPCGAAHDLAWSAWQAARSTQIVPSPPMNVWQQAVDNALVSAHLGVAGEVTAAEAAKMLNDLVCWNIEVATDPLTNGGKKLVSVDAITDTRAVEQPRLTVRLASFPESNGKRNWTAMFVRAEPWDGLIGNAGGITIKRGELWNRVAYEAERARFLIGERDTEPYILDYSTDIQTPDAWTGETSPR